MNKKIIGILLTAVIGLGSGFVSAFRVSEIIQYHFQFSSNNGVKSEKTDGKDITNDIWYLLKQSQDYLKEDITSLLKDESTRHKNLNRYITDGTSLINALGYQKNKLNIEIQNTANKIQSCQNQLTSANEKYIKSLNQKNELAFTQSVKVAKLAKRCIGEEQVNQSAEKSLLQQVQNYSTKIEKRNSYLKSNQSLILRHYDILKPALLKELYPIAIELES